MKRPELDAWFATADDVLDDWQGSEDAMTARSQPDDADPELPLLGDNEADQAWPLRRRRPVSPPSDGRVLRVLQVRRVARAAQALVRRLQSPASS